MASKPANAMSANETIDSGEPNNVVRIIDGSFSFQLLTHAGSEKFDGDPLWTSRCLVTNPDAVFQTHLDYLRAGSEIIETNTYQASVTGIYVYMHTYFYLICIFYLYVYFIDIF